MFGYTNQVLKLGKTLFQLLSEALGLKPNHLVEMECGEGLALLCHYYPLCPQPELTLGTSQHADNDFLTVLLNDGVNGLQVLYQNRWLDVPFVHGALVVNIGDLLQVSFGGKNSKDHPGKYSIGLNLIDLNAKFHVFFHTRLVFFVGMLI